MITYVGTKIIAPSAVYFNCTEYYSFVHFSSVGYRFYRFDFTKIIFMNIHTTNHKKKKLFE